MNKLITILAIMVIVLPLSVSVLFSGDQNLLDANKTFFSKLLDHAMRFGTS